MRPENILDAIGNVDDTCIKNAKEKKTSRKNYWISVGAMAACLALVVAIPFINQTKPGTIPGELKRPITDPFDEQNPGRDNPDIENPDVNKQYAFSYIKVYYNFNNKLKLAPRQNTLETTEMVDVLEYMESLIANKGEGISYNEGEWNYEAQEKDVLINCMDAENNLQAEYLLTTKSLYDYQTNTEYALTEEEVKELKLLLVK